MTTPFRLNVALWQVPTMVVNDASSPVGEAFQREVMNATSNKTIDERMDILKRRLEKAASYFAGLPARNGARTVTVFAAPEYLFAANNFQHFISQADKDRLVTKLIALSNRFPDVVLFPGTIAWKKSALRSGFFAKTFGADRGKRALKRRSVDPGQHSDTDRANFKAARASGNNYFLAENTCFVMHRGKTVLKYHKRNEGGETNRASDGADVFFVPGPRDNVFQVEGLDFGLQICAEMGHALSRSVDVQVAIASSNAPKLGYAALNPGGLYCHADAILPPRVWRQEAGGDLKEIVASARRVGGTLLTRQAATDKVKSAVAATANTKGDKQAKFAEGTVAFDDAVTQLRGRVRYYGVDYDKG